MTENVAFTFSHVEKDLVEYMQDQFFSSNKFLETHEIKENDILQINNKHVLRILLTPRQMELPLAKTTSI